MKAIIPVAGVGTRLRPHTHTVPKVLLHVAGKPILAYILDELVRLKIKDVVLIIGYLGEMIKEYVDKNYKFNVKYVVQETRLGLGHAIHLAKPHVEVEKNEPCLIVLGDTIFEVNLAPIINNSHSAIGIKYVKEPQRFGVVVKKGQFITKLVEKPQRPISHNAIVGLYFIRNSRLLFECLDEIIQKNIKTKEEYQLTDGLHLMIKKGEKMTTFDVDGWFDCGKVETVLSTNRHFLEKMKTEYEFESSIVIPPVFVHPTSHVINSIIGPYVSIDENVTMSHSIVSNSIVSKNASVAMANLEHSLVGENAIVNGRMYSMNVGDSSQIDLG